MNRSPTVCQILSRLDRSADAKIHVHKFKWSHDKLRKKLRKLRSQGRVTYLGQDHKHYVYGPAETK